MFDLPELLVRAAAIGIVATAVGDLWALLMNRLFAVPGPNWALVGRWIGHMAAGRIAHRAIAAAAPIARERAIGWIAHYAIGVGFAAILLLVFGIGWAERPTLWPALTVGLATVLAPFLIMQPAMGAGIAGANLPSPGAARLRSLGAHLVFGVGLFIGGMAWARYSLG